MKKEIVTLERMAQMRLWRESHKEQNRELQHAHYKRNKAAKLRSSRIREERFPKETIPKKYKYAAKARGLTFDIDRNLFMDLITDRCFYCGSDPKPFNGVDRVNNSVGYNEDNVVTACVMCNIAKNRWTREEFEKWICRAALHIGIVPDKSSPVCN